MYGVFRESGLYEGTEADFVATSIPRVQCALKIPNQTLEPRARNRQTQKKFTGTLETDGVAVCFHFKKAKVRKVEPSGDEGTKTITVPEYLTGRVIGVDPGRSNILFASEVLPNGTIKSYRLTRAQYYKEAGINEAKKHTEKWQRSIQAELTSLTKASSKVLSVEDFQKYIGVFVSVRDSLWEEYTKRHWARQRLGLYGGKKRVFAKFLNALEKGGTEEPVLAFGSAKFAPGGRGEVSVPTSRAFKECKYRFGVHVVDEFRTTRINWRDDSLLDSVGRSDRKVAIRGLLWCGSTNVNKFVDRDSNAALNIRRCGMGARPAILDRRLATERLPSQPIKRWLPC
jgi:hypothetical protein